MRLHGPLERADDVGGFKATNGVHREGSRCTGVVLSPHEVVERVEPAVGGVESDDTSHSVLPWVSRAV